MLQHSRNNSNNESCPWAILIVIWVSQTITADLERGNALSVAAFMEFSVEEEEI